jgi:Skp1 family, dimerisation domain
MAMLFALNFAGVCLASESKELMQCNDFIKSHGCDVYQLTRSQASKINVVKTAVEGIDIDSDTVKLCICETLPTAQLVDDEIPVWKKDADPIAIETAMIYLTTDLYGHQGVINKPIQFSNIFEHYKQPEDIVVANFLIERVGNLYSPANTDHSDKLDTLALLIMAASYLEIQSLLDLTIAYMASLIKGRTSEELVKMFHIDLDAANKIEKKDAYETIDEMTGVNSMEEPSKEFSEEFSMTTNEPLETLAEMRKRRLAVSTSPNAI